MSSGMRIAYIVLAYKNPEQVLRLLRRLETDHSSFVVHVDQRTDDAVYEEMRRGARSLAAVHFVKRHRCFWGGFALVRATLTGIDYLISRQVPFDYAALLTGQDYPLASPSAIKRLLSDAEGRSFMSSWRLPSDYWGHRGGLDRIEDWHLVSYRALHIGLPWKRKIPGGLEPFGGDAYWCLARPVVEYVRDFVEQRKSLMRFFEHVLIPDELFFQTIIMNSPLGNTIINDHLHYIDWSRDPGPAILQARDFGTVVSSGKLFARKFDMTVDSAILDMLDDRIESEVGALPR